MRSFLNQIPAWAKNKYILSLIAFAVWMMFFDHNDLIQQVQRRQELKELQDSKQYYQEQIQLTRSELEDLQRNAASLEKVAREKYRMKKEGEDLFLVEEN